MMGASHMSTESNNDVFTLDVNELTIDDIETIEEITGKPIDALSDPDMPKGKMMRAIAFVQARRTDPDATIESVGKLKMQMAVDDPKDPDES